MQNETIRQLLVKLQYTTQPIPAKTLAFQLGISDKTIRKYVNILKYDLDRHGASLQIKAGNGISLTIHDMPKFQAYLAKNVETISLNDPYSRKLYVLFRLISEEDYLDIYTLSNEMYISPSLLRSIIKSLDTYCESYHLTLQRHHTMGYRIVGKETDIRQCLADLCKDSLTISDILLSQQALHDDSTHIASLIAQVLEQYGIAIADDGIQSLTLHVLIALNRIELKNPIQIEKNLTVTRLRTSPEFFVAANIMQVLGKEKQIEIVENEILYLAMHISGKQRIYGHELLQVRTNEDTIVVYNKMLRAIYRYSGYDFFDDADFRTSMYNHLVPFLTRLRGNMQIRKEDELNVKNDYPFAYELAVCGLSTLNEEITTTEISYFALHIALALEKRKESQEKINIVVLCDQIGSLYHMISYKLEQALKENINSIFFIQEKDLAHYDFSSIALALIMTPTNFTFPIPCLTIHHALNETDIIRIQNLVLNSIQTKTISNTSFLHVYHLSSLTHKKEVLQEMIHRLESDYLLPKQYLEEVLHREALGSTAYENRIAIPHALSQFNNLFFVALAILDQPILWDNKSIQIVFLVSIPNKETMRWFMGQIAKAIKNENIAKSILTIADSDALRRLLFSL